MHGILSISYMFQGNQWTAVRAGDRAEDLQKEMRWSEWHRFGAGLGGSDAFVSQNAPENCTGSYFCNFSTLFIPEYGGRTVFYAFRSSTWPSESRRILRRVEGPLPFVCQAVARSRRVLGDAARASFPGFAENTCAWWGVDLVRCLIRFP